ncbi:hypothetical protein [Streptomyces zingiberis]|uniref:Ribosomal protein L7/L12 C-terminal domain-containing protein n=1 Tax=Streptomyces zingiberis TaxID=2053010 RepID=A0ABX1C1C3_9ACTN|nr:hypothetical protein [Streptomyces zingiberis]NJQ03706.1 hypothetical protein [Streptomyces zingiberis]
MDPLLYLLLVPLILLTALGVERRVDRANRRLERVERKLDLVIGHLGIDVSEPYRERVRALIREGRTVEAVREYRSHTGASLVEAKQAVDRMAEGDDGRR